MSTYRIDLLSVRAKLPARREPFWSAPLARGQHLGFRKMSADTSGTWIAKFQGTERSLGAYADWKESERFDRAMKDAKGWFDHMSAGGSTDDHSTVADACKDYVKHVAATRPQAAKEIEKRYERFVYASSIASVRLTKLRAVRLSAWRQTLTAQPAKISRDDRPIPLTRERSLATVSRDLSALRAALNLAYSEGKTLSDLPWRQALKAPAKALTHGHRDQYVTRAQRQALIDHIADPSFRVFVEVMCALPIRPGALARLMARDYSKPKHLLTVRFDKAGAGRQIPIPKTLRATFDAACKGKLPAAPLFSRADGTHWTKDAWWQPFRDAVAAAGLPQELVMYDLRHAVISDLASSGMSASMLAKLAGTSLAVIEQTYFKLDHALASQQLEALALGN